MATAEIRDGCEDARKRRTDYHKEYREAHKSERAAYQKEYEESHKSERAARYKEWRESHKSEQAAWKKDWRESIADGYVAKLLGLPLAIIPPEMLEMKRNRILLTRELVLLKKAIKGE